LKDVVAENQEENLMSVKESVRSQAISDKNDKSGHLKRLIGKCWTELGSNASYFVAISSLSMMKFAVTICGNINPILT